MTRPQSEELARSEKTPLQPDSIESELEARDRPDVDGNLGPVPEGNRPGASGADGDEDKPDIGDS